MSSTRSIFFIYFILVSLLLISKSSFVGAKKFPRSLLSSPIGEDESKQLGPSPKGKGHKGYNVLPIDGENKQPKNYQERKPSGPSPKGKGHR